MCGNRPALLKLGDLHQDGWVRLPEQEHRGRGLGLRGTASMQCQKASEVGEGSSFKKTRKFWWRVSFFNNL